jgi:hypothetical protein
MSRITLSLSFPEEIDTLATASATISSILKPEDRLVLCL